MPDDTTASESDPSGDEGLSESPSRWGCLGGLLILVLLVGGIGWLLGLFEGDGDPHEAGSYAWCERQGLDRSECDTLSDLAERRGMSVSEWLDANSSTENAPAEGSYAWCSAQGITTSECDDVNKLAKEFGETPSEIVRIMRVTVDLINEG
jgi:hypothetical protein